MTTRAEIVAAARSLIGTPYVNHQRVAGPNGGVDCVGLPIMVARICGIIAQDADFNGYSLHPDGTMIPLLDASMGGRVAERDILPGDCVIVSWGDARAHHFGIVAPHSVYQGRLSIIHAYPKQKKVCEHRLAFDDFMRFVAAYKFPGVL
jgi:cell wall-associated NlpC family hydrolase